MRIGSLFSGIGGLELGLEWAGLGETVWQVERDPFCRSILARHWPNAKRYHDVKEVGSHNLKSVDLICGGFPCTDISLAGKGAGLAGEHSGLWFEFDRIIGELRPAWVVVENVAALKSRGLDRVLSDLDSRGYDAIWDCIPADSVGAPHERDRLFVVAWQVPDADGDRLRLGAERGDGRAQETDGGDAEPVELGAEVADSSSGGLGELRRAPRGDRLADRRGEEVANAENDHGRPGECGAQEGTRPEKQRGRGPASGGDRSWPPGPDELQAWRTVPVDAQPAFCAITHGIPRRLDRLRCLGNAVVPAVAEVIGRVVRILTGYLY